MAGADDLLVRTGRPGVMASGWRHSGGRGSGFELLPVKRGYRSVRAQAPTTPDWNSGPRITDRAEPLRCDRLAACGNGVGQSPVDVNTKRWPA